MRSDQLYLRNQRARRDVALFKRYMNSSDPAAFNLPGNALLAVRSLESLAVDTPALERNGVMLYAPAGMASGGIWQLGWSERGASVLTQAGFELLLDTGLGKWVPIGAAGNTP